MMMLTSVSSAAAAQSAQKGQQDKAPAAAQDTSTQATPASATTPSASAPGAAQANAQPFSRWLGQQGGDAAQALQASLAAVTDTAATTAPDAAAQAATPAAGDGAAADDGKTAAAAPDSSLLAAMAMPLMPLSPQQVTQAVQAAQGGARAGTTDAGMAETPAQPLAVSGQDGRRAALALPQAALMAAPQQAAAQAAQAETTAANVHQAVEAGATGGNAAGSGTQDGSADAQPVQAGTNPAVAAPVMAAPAAPAQPAADTVKLAGPPSAWRQTLQETLGDKLHVQVGGNVQQATISIEPPQLGRIDIAIRHSAGTLEVNISATNGEVLRQLQTVSDNLRNDLSQRQYTEVAVSVTPAPKNSAAPFGDPQQQQGRGRQQGRDQDNEPGRGLAEAGNPASVFKLGRDS